MDKDAGHRVSDDERTVPRRVVVGRKKPGALARVSAWMARLRAVRMRPATPQNGRRAHPAAGAVLREGVVMGHEQGHADPHAAHLAANQGLAALARALDNPDPDVRARAAALICELADARAGQVVKTMMQDPSSEVRRAAARAAGRVGTLEVAACLIVALTDPDAEVRAAAAEGLSGIAGRRIPIEAQDGTVQAEQIKDLKSWWREKRIAELLENVVR